MYTCFKNTLIFNQSNHFSIFSNLGDLSLYTLEDLKGLAINFKTTTMYLDNEILAIWTNKNTKYEILYTLSGSFIKIKSETWLNPYLAIKR
jgi:hypothetical protein